MSLTQENNILNLKKIVASFPLKPGVYIMKDKDNKIIYIGKAKYLRKRVSSYFNNNINHNSKIYKLMSNVILIDYIITDSELEALILECSLIKKYKPIYNILLKDDKGYKFIKVSSPPYSKISVARFKINDGSVYIGPYINSFMAFKIVDTVNKIFKLPNCNKDIDSSKFNRACLNYYLNLCSGPCAKNITEEEYQKNIDQAVRYIKSGMKTTVKQLTKRMEKESSQLNFEEAAKTRDIIKAIKQVNYSQKVVYSEKEKLDVIAVIESQYFICATILVFREFKLVDKKQYVFKSNEMADIIRKNVLLQYYIDLKDMPLEIFIDKKPDDFELIKEYIFKEICISIPKKKNDLELMEMAKKNAEERIAQEMRLVDKGILNINNLKNLLQLKSIPEIIEAYDISNYGSQTIVGGMVVFENGSPKKSNYKLFKLKYVFEQNDYNSMMEIIKRRFSRYKFNEDSSVKNGFMQLPDLILIDGGYGHISSVKKILDSYNISIPVYGMVKDKNHKTKELVDVEGQSIDIKKDMNIYLFITQIQDEIHRFTINYSRKSHSKLSMEYEKNKIPGIGDVRFKLLIDKFKTIDKIKEASIDEIAEVKGFSKKIAEKIYNFYH